MCRNHLKTAQTFVTFFAALMFSVSVPASWAADTMKTLYSFTGGADGSNPVYSPMVRDGVGNLYGITFNGGAYGLGVVFELSPNSDGTWTETVLHTFAGGMDGAMPAAGPVRDKAGNFYGVTEFGGGLGSCPIEDTNYFCGTAFKLSRGKS